MIFFIMFFMKRIRRIRLCIFFQEKKKYFLKKILPKITMHIKINLGDNIYVENKKVL